VLYFTPSSASDSPNIENLRGSNANGSDGGTSRVITLNNTATTKQENVFLNGVRQTLTADYTVSHLSASSTITFVGNLYNADYITVLYFT